MQPTLILTVKDLATQIRAFRRKRGLTQGELARQLGATQHWISDLEHGKEGAPIGAVFRVMAHLGMQLDVSDRRETRTLAPGPGDLPSLGDLASRPFPRFRR